MAMKAATKAAVEPPVVTRQQIGEALGRLLFADLQRVPPVAKKASVKLKVVKG